MYPGVTYWSQVRGSRVEYECVYSVYGMLILRDQLGVRTLGFISLEAASGHHIARPKEVRGSKPPYNLLLLGLRRLHKHLLRSGKNCDIAQNHR